tara:strand:+ start:10421 stop:10540 length:120 start_codon:yes stop_codon:yes gene_type:complete
MTKFEQARKDKLIEQSFEYIKKIEAILTKIDESLLNKAA